MTSIQKNWPELFNEGPEKAWNEFLHVYNNLILAVISKIVQDHDVKMELYTFTLEKFQKNDFEKLTVYFQKKRSYNFEIWISIVTKNFCFERLRQEKGKRILPNFLKKCSIIERKIYEYLYHKGYSYDETFQILRSKHEYRETYDCFMNCLENLKNKFRQHTRIKIPLETAASLFKYQFEDINDVDQKQISSDFSLNSSIDPGKKVIRENLETVINETIQSLPVQEQLMIKLYYYQDQTLQEIADILKMRNIWQVQRKITKALKSLKLQLKRTDIDLSDLDV